MTKIVNSVKPLHAARSGQLPDLGLTWTEWVMRSPPRPAIERAGSDAGSSDDGPSGFDDTMSPIGTPWRSPTSAYDCKPDKL